jgi:hypothetical protein
MDLATLEGAAVRTRLATLAFAIVAAPFVHSTEPLDRQDVLVIVGAPGTEEFAKGFTDAANAWRDAAEKAGASFTVIGLDEPAEGSPEDRELLKQAIEQIDDNGTRPEWIVYIGHGTFDRREARLNLRGSDVTESEFAEWLKPHQRPLVIVHGGSASGTFISGLSGPKRIIVTATQSGAEVNYARFGEYFAHAIGSNSADIDQDDQTSILEAFLSAAQQTRNFYDEAGRLMTEHALIDDNGDGRGTPADWFRGTRAVKKAEDDTAPDGVRANRIGLVESETERRLTAEQRALRDELEGELEELRARKSSMLESIYLNELEALFRKLSPIYVPGVEAVPEQESPTVENPADS